MRDYALGTTFDLKFTTRKFSTGAPFTLAGSPVISAYPDNSTTQLTAGITLSVDFDSVTGLHNVRVVASGGNGYAAGSNYALVITTGTVDGVSVVGEVIGEFSLEAQSPLRPTTTGRTLDVSATGEADVNLVQIGGVAQSATDLKDFADDGYDPATNKVQGVVLTDTVTTYTGNTPQTGDSFARLGPPAGPSVSFDIASIFGQTTSIDARLPADPADESNVLAAIAGVQADTDNLQTRLPAALVGGRIDASVGAMANDTVTAAALATDAVTEIVAAVFAKAFAAKYAALTFEEAIGVILASQAGITSGAGTGTFRVRDLLDSSDVIVASVTGGNRTATTVTP